MAEQLYPLRPGNQTGRRAPNFGGRSGTGSTSGAPASATQAAAPTTPTTALGSIGVQSEGTNSPGLPTPDFDVGRAGMPLGEFVGNTLTGMAAPASFAGFVGGQMVRGGIDAVRGRESPFSFAGPLSRATFDSMFGGGRSGPTSAAANTGATTPTTGSPEQPSFANPDVVSTAIGGPPEPSFANPDVVSTAIGGPPGEGRGDTDGGKSDGKAGGAEAGMNTGDTGDPGDIGDTGGGEAFRHGGPVPMDDDLDLEGVDITAHEGEFVLRPEAVEAYGQDVIAALNEMRIPPEVLRQILALVGGEGGMPEEAVPEVDDGGMARMGGMVRPSARRGPRFGSENFAGRPRPPTGYKTALRHL